MREYERFTTTCANAYVQPLVAGYLSRLENDLNARGLSCQLFLMLSSGGITTVETARAFPIRLFRSGPAGAGTLLEKTAPRAGRFPPILFQPWGTPAPKIPKRGVN